MDAKTLRYLGHESQLSGVEEHRLVGGKGEGMRLYEVHNGRGLDRKVLECHAHEFNCLRV